VMQTNQNIRHKFPPPFNLLERRAFGRVAAAYVCSETVREVLRAKGFRKPAPLISYGVDTKSFRPGTVNRENLGQRADDAALWAECCRARGSNVWLQHSTNCAAKPGSCWSSVTGSERQEFEQRLSASGVLDRAEFTGANQLRSVPEYFKKLDVLVIPTQTTKRVREQFGRVIVEAWPAVFR